jgi:PKD repeat protein
LTIEEGKAPIEFIASVSGGVASYFYSWDLDEDDAPDAGLSSDRVPYTYTAGGNYKAAVTVTDSGSCGLSHTADLTVVVVDPEADPQDACHPTAQKIAEAVSIIFLSDRAEFTYTCEDIFNIFEGALTGYHTGFGRLWHAYQLTQTIPDLTWEEIRDWKLDGSSWGALTQLNRIADTLDGFGIRNLYDLVLSGENSVGDIRTAARAAVRYEADFSDALIRLSEGANSGELGQFYKLAAELDVDPSVLDIYLADGASLSELRHAAKMSERTGSDWTEVMDAKGLGSSWGEIGQAYKLADDENSVAEILATGVKEFRATQREEAQLLRDEERAQREAERSNRTAQPQGTNDRDLRTADQLASKYGVSPDDVMKQFEVCKQDWNCVRAYFRALDREPRGKDKNK